jgi:hypothetical protein
VKAAAASIELELLGPRTRATGIVHLADAIYAPPKSAETTRFPPPRLCGTCQTNPEATSEERHIPRATPLAKEETEKRSKKKD